MKPIIWERTPNAAPLDLDSFAGFTSGDWSADPQANARLIAAAPALLAECRRLRAENQRLKGALEVCIDGMQDALDGGEYWQENFAKSDLPAARAALEPQL